MACCRSRYHGALRTSSSPIIVRRVRLTVSLTLIVAALAGCLPGAPAGRYDKDGVAFDHLAGWAVAEDTQKTARASGVKQRLGIVGGAEADITPTTRTERSLLGTTVAGLQQQFAVELLNARMPHTVEYFLTRIGGRDVIFIDQVANEHRNDVNAGLQKDLRYRRNRPFVSLHAGP